jgi:hypothetical protein
MLMVRKPCITLQVVAKLNYHVHQMHMHSGKIGNVFNGMTPSHIMEDHLYFQDVVVQNVKIQFDNSNLELIVNFNICQY